MIKKEFLVDIPSRKIYIQKKNGIEYIFYRVEFYRTSDNKSRSKSRCIGIRDTESQKMWPNNIYFELFGNTSSETYKTQQCENVNNDEVKTDDPSIIAE